MNNHSVKFIFLFVVVGAVLFSHMAYEGAFATNPQGTGGAAMAAQNQTVPRFILPQVAVSANDNAGAETTASATSSAHNTPPPTLHDAASLVVDIKSGIVFETLNADKRWPTASIAKLMAATVVADKIDPSAEITITDQMFAADLTEPILAVGGTYTAADLLRMMLLPSSNVAAEAIATFYGRDAFLKEMNARVAAWGMGDTYFSDPSGISSANESSANDLLTLAEKIYADYPQIFQITRTPQATITEIHSGRRTIIKSINNFAGDADFIGGKTGHTDEANGNLLSVFRYNTQPIVIIVLGTDDRFGDTQKLYDWLKKNLK